MKIGLVTDTHYGARNDSPVFHSYFDRSMKWFFDVLDEQKIQHVIHLGDLFDRRKYLSFLTAKHCREQFLKPLHKRNIETHIIAGNHDHYYKDTWTVNALDEIVTGKYTNIHTYNKATTIMIDGVPICLIPWINASNALSTVSTINLTNAEIAMGHLEIKGFEEYAGIVAKHGQDKCMYDKFDMVFTGHFHHRSSINNIHYLGAFAEYMWSDFGDDRGFHVFDTETRKVEYHKNPYQIFKMLAYDDKKYPNVVELIQATDYTGYKDTYVKVVCVNKENPYAFDMLLDKLYKAGPIDISVIEDATTFSDNEENVEVDQTEDTPKILSKYIDGLSLPVENDAMKRFMHEIYTEALSKEHVQ